MYMPLALVCMGIVWWVDDSQLGFHPELKHGQGVSKVVQMVNCVQVYEISVCSSK